MESKVEIFITRIDTFKERNLKPGLVSKWDRSASGVNIHDVNLLKDCIWEILDAPETMVTDDEKMPDNVKDFMNEMFTFATDLFNEVTSRIDAGEPNFTIAREIPFNVELEENETLTATIEVKVHTRQCWD